MEISYCYNLFNTIVCYLIVYLAGSMIYSVVAEPIKNIESEFKKNVLGIWTVITGYSLLKTHLVSMSLGMPLLAMCWVLYKRPRLRFQWSFYPAGFIFSILLLILFYTLLYFEFYNPFTKSFYYFSVDLPTYASLVEKLIVTGVESTKVDFYFMEPVRNLYHYGDIWFAAFFVDVLGLNAMQVIYFIYADILIMVIILGAISLALELIKGENRKWETICISVFL